MCYPAGEFLTGDSDVLLGLRSTVPGAVTFWMSAAQFEYWSHTHLTIDVVPGRGAGFSLEARRACASSSAPGCSPTTRRPP